MAYCAGVNQRNLNLFLCWHSREGIWVFQEVEVR